MPSVSSPATRYGVHHVQLARAVFGAIAALMITFSSDHSASVGLSVFSGFAIATGLIWGLSAWLVFPRAQRGTAVLLAVVSILAGMTAGILTLRSITLFFVVVAAWLLITGVIEAIAGARALRPARAGDAAHTRTAPVRAHARDALTLGVITVVAGVGMLLVPWGYSLEYTVPGAPTPFTLTGIIIGVGIFGAYTAIVAVFLAIAGLSPRPAEAPVLATADEAASGIATARAEESA